MSDRAVVVAPTANTDGSPIAKPRRPSKDLLQIIERAARDPLVDVAKMERLLQMQKELHQARAEADFNLAMTACQEEMKRIATDADNPHTTSRYASYAQLDRHLRPIYTKHGFALSFDEADSPKGDHIRMLCYVSHRGGFTRTYHRDMPVDGTGPKGNAVMTKTHASASGQSYAMRYLLRGIFNVAVGEADDDGNRAGNAVTFVNAEQLANIQALLSEVGSTKGEFLGWLSSLGGPPINTLEEIPTTAYLHCVRALQAKRRKA